MHCDPDQVDTLKHIKQALEIIEVERIDHGVNIVADPDLMDFAIQKQLGFTICPISNLYIYHDMKAKPTLELLKKGALVSFNSDDPGYMGSNYIDDNYYKFAEKYHLSREDLVKIAKNSFLSSWISNTAKKFYLKQIDDYIKLTNK